MHYLTLYPREKVSDRVIGSEIDRRFEMLEKYGDDWKEKPVRLMNCLSYTID